MPKAHFLARGNKIASSSCILKIVPGQQTAGAASEGALQRLRSCVSQRDQAFFLGVGHMNGTFGHTSLEYLEKGHLCSELSYIFAKLVSVRNFVPKHKSFPKIIISAIG